MTDTMTLEQRHRCMSQIHSKGTKPKMKVRKWLWTHGYRYRLSEPSSIKSTSRPSNALKSKYMPPIVKRVKGFSERSGTKRMSTSLSAVSSPLAKEPNSHAFKTGCVLKTWGMVKGFISSPSQKKCRLHLPLRQNNCIFAPLIRQNFC